MGISGRKQPRPTGVTVLGALQIVNGVVLALISVVLIVAAEVLVRRVMVPVRAEIVGVFGVIFLIGAAINFVLAWGYLSGMGWARVIGLIFASIGVLGGLVTFPAGIFNLVLNGLIIYYLTRLHVYRWFKGEREMPAPQGQETVPTPPPPERPVGV